jgi:hypothetical protein
VGGRSPTADVSVATSSGLTTRTGAVAMIVVSTQHAPSDMITIMIRQPSKAIPIGPAKTHTRRTSTAQGRSLDIATMVALSVPRTEGAPFRGAWDTEFVSRDDEAHSISAGSLPAFADGVRGEDPCCRPCRGIPAARRVRRNTFAPAAVSARGGTNQ